MRVFVFMIALPELLLCRENGSSRRDYLPNHDAPQNHQNGFIAQGGRSANRFMPTAKY